VDQALCFFALEHDHEYNNDEAEKSRLLAATSLPLDDLNKEINELNKEEESSLIHQLLSSSPS
jgi:hypothetical protein